MRKAKKRVRKQKKRHPRTLTQSFVTCCVVPLYIMFPRLVQATFSLAACRSLGDSRLFLVQDLDYECYTPDHISYLLGVGLPGLLIYVLGLPIFAFLLLRSNRSKLHLENTLYCYGFLYLGFKDKCPPTTTTTSYPPFQSPLSLRLLRPSTALVSCPHLPLFSVLTSSAGSTFGRPP